MKNLLTGLLLLCLPLVAPAAGGFAGVDYVFSTIEPDKTSGSADVDALQFRFGTWLNAERTFGGEFRAALGLNDDDINGVDVEIDRHYGGYLRGQFPGNVPIRPYGLIGVTRVETTEKLGADSDSEDYFGLSLGLGAEMDMQKNVFLTLEYLRAIDSGGDEISNLSLGIGGRF